MNDESTIPPPPDPDPPPRPTAAPEPTASPPPLSPEEHQQIVALYQQGRSVRRIAKALRRRRQTIRDTLLLEGVTLRSATAPASEPASKLDPYRETIKAKAAARLPVTRILREIREQGYTGGRSILAHFVRSLPSATATPIAKKRFETGPGEEMQADWSVYKVLVAGVMCVVHALLCVLGYSRYLHLRFYRDERQSTLLEGLARAFEAFGGCTLRVVFDNMATVVLGRVGKNRTVLWHPRLLDFARHYGFEPVACRVRHPDRKGKCERVFDYAEKDLLRDSSFASMDDLNRRADLWASTIANRRLHGTTRLVPAEAFLTERDFIVRLPEARFAVHQDSVREVYADATVSIHGTLYTIPEQLARQPSVPVRLYAEHFEILDPQGEIAFSRRYVSPPDKGRLQIDNQHYLTRPCPSPVSAPGAARIDEALLTRFPSLAPLVEGITRRMKSLAHIHLRVLWRLAETYGETHFLAAASRAQRYRRYDAQAVRRILERLDLLPPEPAAPVHAANRARIALGEVDPGSLDQYAHIDTTTAAGQQPQEPLPASIKPEDGDEKA